MTDEIARLAYLYWQHRIDHGVVHGSALNDWLRAERDIAKVGFYTAWLLEIYWLDCQIFALMLYEQKAELRKQLDTTKTKGTK
jgi:hypothetical protein